MGSWLDGPGTAGTSAAGAGEYPGARLGRPAQGPGALASFLRRAAALLVDWIGCVAIAQGLLSGVGRPDLMALVALLVVNVLLVGTLGTTVGHRLLGLRVETLDGRPPGPVKALVRSLLLVLLIPPLVTDADHRGMHDRLSGTLVAVTR